MGKDLFSPLFFPLRKRKEKQVHLLSPDEFRAENAHEEHTHTYTRARIFRRISIERQKIRAQNSLIFLVVLSVFFRKEKKTLTCSLQKADKMTERKSSRKTLTPKRFIPEETEKKDKDASGGQKSGGSKVSLISY